VGLVGVVVVVSVVSVIVVVGVVSVVGVIRAISIASIVGAAGIIVVAVIAADPATTITKMAIRSVSYERDLRTRHSLKFDCSPCLDLEQRLLTLLSRCLLLDVETLLIDYFHQLDLVQRNCKEFFVAIDIGCWMTLLKMCRKQILPHCQSVACTKRAPDRDICTWCAGRRRGCGGVVEFDEAMALGVGDVNL